MGLMHNNGIDAPQSHYFREIYQGPSEQVVPPE